MVVHTGRVQRHTELKKGTSAIGALAEELVQHELLFAKRTAALKRPYGL